MDQSRHGRTILEVEANGQKMVLKVVNAVFKTMIDGHVETPTQQEVRSFNLIPDTLKGIFVENYAHGRLYVDETQAEIILMEKMCKTELSKAIGSDDYTYADKMKWWTQVVYTLNKMHNAGWTHGDCHFTNILFTQAVGVGALKWIDPERMTDLSTVNHKQAAVSKLQDIYYVLLHNNFVGYRTPRRDALLVDYVKLHQRLKAIKTIAVKEPTWLSDIIIFDLEILGIMTKDGYFDSRITLELLSKLQIHEQYRYVDSVDFSGFMNKLTDIYYLDNVLHYLILQINKTFTANFMDITTEDLNIPSNIPSIRMRDGSTQPQVMLPNQHQAHQHVYANTHPQALQPMQQVVIAPLWLSINNEVINITNQAAQQYGYYNSNGGIQLCILALGPSSTFLPGTINYMFNGKNGQPFTLLLNNVQRNLRISLLNGRYLQVGILNQNQTFQVTSYVDLTVNSPQVLPPPQNFQ